MTINELLVSSEEQRLTLLNGYSANIKFDPFHKRWYYDLYQGDTLMFAGVPLVPDTFPLDGFTNYYLAVIDKLNDNEQYEPYNELGSRLGLLEIQA